MSKFFFRCPEQYFIALFLRQRDNKFDWQQEVKEEYKAGKNQLPARDIVHFKLELKPNHRNSQLKNTICHQALAKALPSPSKSYGEKKY